MSGKEGGKLDIPKGITQIGDGAFRGCKNLKHVTIPKGVTDIWRRAFYACAGMESIVIPEGVTRLGIMHNVFGEGIAPEVFKRCYNLKDVYIPASVKQIHNDEFSGCGKGKYVRHELTIHAPAGSYAEKYAKDHGYLFMPTY